MSDERDELAQQVEDLEDQLDEARRLLAEKTGSPAPSDGDYYALEELRAKAAEAEAAGDYHAARIWKTRTLLKRVPKSFLDPKDMPSAKVPDDIDEQIAAAEAAGDWKTSLRLKSQKLKPGADYVATNVAGRI